MSWNFCLFFKKIVPKTYLFENFRWGIIPLNFMGFLLGFLNQKMTSVTLNTCHNYSLGFATKARACKGAGQEWSLGVTFHVPGRLRVWESENWTSTLLSEFPLWELESRWTSKFSGSDCKGQNPWDWGIPYIIEKLLELTCLKWVRMTHLDIWNTSYAQKKGRESNWQFILIFFTVATMSISMI